MKLHGDIPPEVMLQHKYLLPSSFMIYYYCIVHHFRTIYIIFYFQDKNLALNFLGLFFVLDILECSPQAGSFPCHARADCIETFGSFICRCKTGYEGNGQSCTGNFPVTNFQS